MWEANRPLLPVGSFGECCGCVRLTKMNRDNGSTLDYLANDLCCIQRLGSTAITQHNCIYTGQEKHRPFRESDVDFKHNRKP